MATIAEFLASVGFAVDEKSLKNALVKVGAFGAAVSAAAGFAIAGIMRIAEGEKGLAAQAERLGVSVETMEALGYVAGQTGSSAEAVARSMEALLAKNPRIRDAGKALETVGRRMAGMSEQARRLYASRMGIDPALIPMLTRDVSALKDEYRAMYTVAGRDAKKAAEDSKAFLAEIGKLKTLSGMLAKSVGLAFIGQIRRDVESLRRVIAENFSKIKRLFEAVIGVVLRIAGVVGAFVGRVVKWAAALISWYDRLDDGQKKLVLGVTALAAAWKLLNAGFLASPLGIVVAGLAGIVALVDDCLTYMEGGESYFNWGPWVSTIQKAAAALKRIGPPLAAGVAALAIFKKASGVLGALPGMVGGATKAFKLLNVAIKANPIGLVLALIAMAAVAIIQHWDDIKKACLKVWDAVGAKVRIVADAVRKAWQAVKDWFARLWASIVDSFPQFGGWISRTLTAFQDFCGRVRRFFGDLWAWVLDKLPDLGTWAAGAASRVKALCGRAASAIGAFAGRAAALFGKVWDALEPIWKGIAAVAAGVRSALGPALKTVMAGLDGLFTLLGNLATLMYRVFTGDLSGALDAAKQLFSDLIDSWSAVISGFCDAVRAFFAGLWGHVAESFPDFAAWAEGAAASIRNVFAPAIQWVKDKIAALTDWLPDWVKEKMGLTGKPEPETPDAPSPVFHRSDAPSPNLAPPPSGPMLTPSPAQGAALANTTRTVDIKADTTINVHGADSPAEVAHKVAGAQTNVNADIVRHTKRTAW